MGQAHLLVGIPEAQAKEGYGPSSKNIKHKITLGYSRGQFNPRQTHKLTGKRGKNGIGLSLKENLKYPRKAAFTAIQYSAPDKAVFFSFYNHPQRLWV